VPFSVNEKSDGLPRKSRRPYVLTCLFPSSSAYSTPNMPPIPGEACH
jgi:hypothetical protein